MDFLLWLNDSESFSIGLRDFAAPAIDPCETWTFESSGPVRAGSKEAVALRRLHGRRFSRTSLRSHVTVVLRVIELHFVVARASHFSRRITRVAARTLHKTWYTGPSEMITLNGPVRRLVRMEVARA
jgi:hypothetical protein